MRVMRPIEHGDLESLVDIAKSLGDGMTTLPADHNVLSAKINDSISSFASDISEQQNQFVLVLESEDDKDIEGVSALYPNIGSSHGFFSYHIDRLVKNSPEVNLKMECNVLHLSNTYTGYTEIGTLAVNPKCRNNGAGKLLAKARYLMLASFPELFSKRVIAELRGWQEPDGHSPFWHAIGEKFFNIPFADADKISAIHGNKFIADLMPKFSLYVDLIRPNIEEYLGKPHQTSQIAYNMLLKENFNFEQFIDVFDGGPQVVCDLTNIKSVADSKLALVSDNQTSAEQYRFLVCNQKRATFRLIEVVTSVVNQQIYLNEQAIKILNVSKGETVRYLKLN